MGSQGCVIYLLNQIFLDNATGVCYFPVDSLHLIYSIGLPSGY